MSNFTIAVLGSHSALDVCRGARDEGFKTLVIAEKGRDKTYAKYFKSRDPSINSGRSGSEEPSGSMRSSTPVLITGSLYLAGEARTIWHLPSFT